MEVVESREDVGQMLNELINDLGRDDLVLVERLPHVREYERYRDVVTNMLREFHVALVLIRLVFVDGSRKSYVFLIRGDGERVGELPSRGFVEGYVLLSSHVDKKIVYRPAAFRGPEEVRGRIMELANMYRRAEERISQLRLTRDAHRDLAMFYHETGD